jgi:hypothetical protein
MILSITFKGVPFQLFVKDTVFNPDVVTLPHELLEPVIKTRSVERDEEVYLYTDKIAFIQRITEERYEEMKKKAQEAMEREAMMMGQRKVVTLDPRDLIPGRRN